MKRVLVLGLLWVGLAAAVPSVQAGFGCCGSVCKYGCQCIGGWPCQGDTSTQLGAAGPALDRSQRSTLVRAQWERRHALCTGERK